MSADKDTGSLVRKAQEAAARLAAMQEPVRPSEVEAQEAQAQDDGQAFRDHLYAVGPSSWISISLQELW